MELYASVSKPESSTKSVMITWSQPTDSSKTIYVISGITNDTNGEKGVYEDDVLVTALSNGTNIVSWHPNGAYNTKYVIDTSTSANATAAINHMTALATNSFVLIALHNQTYNAEVLRVLQWASNSTVPALENGDAHCGWFKRNASQSGFKQLRAYGKSTGIVSIGTTITSTKSRQILTVDIEYKIGTGSWTALVSGLIEKNYLHNTSSLTGNITYRLRAYDGLEYSSWVETAQTALPTAVRVLQRR